MHPELFRPERAFGDGTAVGANDDSIQKGCVRCLAAYDIIWEEALQELRDNLPDFHFKTFFVSRKPFFEEHGTYYFQVSSSNEQELMQKKFAERVTQAISAAAMRITGEKQDVTVVYLTPSQAEDFRTSFTAHRDAGNPEDGPETHHSPVHSDASESSVPQTRAEGQDAEASPNAVLDTSRTHIPAVPAARSQLLQLNPAHTFESFVVGESNDYANAVAHAVANSPGQVYNPLFLYGGVGLGKTHLMHAIGNEILAKRPDARIVYVTTESFTNELIYMIQSGSSVDRRQEFRDKYRRADILMIDDIQFIAGKETTQEEFFHTFNALHADKKQIVISSDRPPTAISQLEERMRSRFEWGIQAQIKPPKYETRLAILKKKAEERPDMLPVDPDAFSYMADQPNSNIRTLEGALSRVNMYAMLHQLDRVDRKTAIEALDVLVTPSQREITADRVCRAVCDHYGVTEDDLRGQRRTKDIAFARQVAMYIMRQLTKMSYKKIAEFFQKKDHTTVMHAEKAVVVSMEDNANVKRAIEDIMAHVRST